VDRIDFTAFLFAYDQINISESELQEAVCELSHTVGKYNLNISSKKTKAMAFAVIKPVGGKITVEGKIINKSGF
jgi:hypothetical protein